MDRVLRSPEIVGVAARYDRRALVRLIRSALSDHRRDIARGGSSPTMSAVVDDVLSRLESDWSQWPNPVVNCTGVILHTNLGRAPLSSEAIAAIRDAAAYSDLEYDLDTAGRGSRQRHVASMLQSLTGAEAAYVTVNGASAVLLLLSTLAARKDVLVSRGQAVEIGGGFRIPEVLRQSGARLVDVGTTNRTRLEDYEAAITPRTGAVLHVHSSNFRVVGFTEKPALHDLAGLARRHGVLLLDDNGSGSLLDTAQFGLAHEPTPIESLAAGAHAVAFSGDKLLGGPQVGIILASEEIVARVSRHPLARALRPDKTTFAALSATLLAYLRGDAEHTLPLWRMIAQPVQSIERRAQAFATRAAHAGIAVELSVGESTVGGGSLPGETLPTVLLALPPALTVRELRLSNPPIVARAVGRRASLDLRTVPEECDEDVFRAVAAAHARIVGRKSPVLDSAAR